MMVRKAWLAGVAVAVAAGIAGRASAQADLKVGKDAPTILGESGIVKVQGDIDAAVKAPVYVVEFWATWCGPCKQSIPHLNDLYASLRPRGLRVIGVSTDSAEKQGGRAKVQDAVNKFVKSRGTGMSYDVYWDSEGKLGAAFMQAAGQSGIPCAFVISNGKVIFIGNPHPQADADKMERIIRLAIRGRYDPELSPKGEAIIREADKQRKLKNYQQATALYGKAVESSTKLFLDAAFANYDMLLVDEKDANRAQAYAKDVLGIYEEAQDAAALREWSAKLAADPSLPAHDAATALDAAKRFEGLAKPSDPDVPATLAKALAAKGDMDAAVVEQTKAWRLAVPDLKPEYKRDLDAYKAAKARTGTGTQAKLPATGAGS